MCLIVQKNILCESLFKICVGIFFGTIFPSEFCRIDKKIIEIRFDINIIHIIVF